MKNNLVYNSIKRVIKNNVGLFILMLFIIIGTILLSLVPPQVLRIIIDKCLSVNSTDKLLNLAVIYLLVLALGGIFNFLKEVMLVVAGQKITKEIRIEMINKLEKIKTEYFSSNQSGIITSRFTNDVDSVSSMFTSGIISLFIDCFKVIGIVISIFVFSKGLGIIVAAIIPIIFIITRIFQKMMLSAQIKNRVLIGKVNNHISESLKNISMIKSFSKEKYMEDKYKEYLSDNFATVENVNFLDSVFSPIIQLIKALVISLVVLLSSDELRLVGLSVGMVAASIDLITNLFSPIESLGMELQSIQQSIAGIKRVNTFFMEKEDEGKNTALTAADIIGNNSPATIKFDEVCFAYDDNTPVLKNISLDICDNEKVTFIGRTGAGKSTLFNLIMGLYKPTSGTISINGIDVYTIPNNLKRQIFGYVNQSFSFISGTVYEQISLKDDSIEKDAVYDAMKMVGLHDYVMTLENGYDTVVQHDSLFSQGQKQLLNIARSIVTNPPILLLDEITANLDSITEKHIVEVLQNVSMNRTILSISHRLSSMIDSDRIVILEYGRIKSAGTPDELIENDEWYRSHIQLEKHTWE